ncbi:MAG: helix-turn-helix domain-containing protein [Motilibacteraceae bacterium]
MTEQLPTWPAWLAARMELRGFRSSSELARAAGIPDSVISRWRSGASVPSVVQLRRLQGPLQVPLLTLLVAAGHLTADEVALELPPDPEPRPRDTRDAIRRDAGLSEDLRHLLEVQYDAMLAVAAARASGQPSR